MYKLILVEDEADVRKAILKMVDWNSLGFTICGEADNGEDALELVMETEPDIVITDINMPYMNGVELAEHIGKTNPATKIVFLTGRPEFEYAQRALRPNVINYILKPISRAELSTALMLVRQHLDKERRQIRNLTTLRQSYNQQRDSLINSFLISLITGSAKGLADIMGKAAKYGLRLAGPAYLLFTVSMDKNSLADADIYTDDPELLLVSAANYARKVSQEAMGAESFIYQENAVVILSGEEGSLFETPRDLLCQIRQHLQQICGLSVTIGVSRIFRELSEAKAAYNDSLTAIYFRVAHGGDRIIYISDLEASSGQAAVISENCDDRLCILVKTGTIEQVSDYINQVFQTLCEQRASLSGYQMCMIELFSQLIRAAKGVYAEIELNVSEGLRYMADLYKQDSVEEIKLWFEMLCSQAMNSIRLHRRDAAEITVDKMCEYIKAHYSDEKLCLNQLSAEFGLSPNYLGSLLKKVKNETFTAFVSRIKMGKAMDLLVATPLSVKDIAKELGYNDPQYFSTCFKKFYKLSPAQMRSQKKQERQQGAIHLA